MQTLNVLTIRLHDLSEFKHMIFLFHSHSSCNLLPFIGIMILLPSQCLQILQANILFVLLKLCKDVGWFCKAPCPVNSPLKTLSVPGSFSHLCYVA